MSKIEKMRKQAQSMGYDAEVLGCPEWMMPFDKMLVIKMARSGFIYQVVPFNSITEEYRVMK